MTTTWGLLVWFVRFMCIYTDTKGFRQVKQNKKIKEKLGSGWVGQALTRIMNFFLKSCFFVIFVLFSYFQMFQKKKIG